MKKIFLFTCLTLSIIPATFSAVVSTTCDSINGKGTSTCDACFKEENPLYTCSTGNPNCTSKEGITLMSDIVTNTATSGNKIMYDNDEGQIYTYPLQGTIWSKSATQLLDMFQFPAAYIQGRENFTVGPTAAWSSVSNAYIGYKLTPGNSVKWTEFKPNQWLRPDNVINGASRTLPALRAEFIPRLYSSATTYTDHRQCVFYYVRFCGDNVIDSDKSEQCDNGTANGTAGNPCNAVCQTVTNPTLSCTNLTLAPTTLSKDGGTITATCAASTQSGTTYKFVLKQGTTTISTKPYQTSTQTTFNLPANTTASSKSYSVDCFVDNGNQTDITSAACNKNITVPGTPTVPAECELLTLTPTTANINTPIDYVCTAKNPTSTTTYTILRDGISVGTQPIGTMNISTPNTYTIKCIVDDKVPTPASCTKTVTITTPPPSPIPSIFIDKDDSTPGDPDSDGNDIQRVQTNGTATFTIKVINNGNEALKTVAVTDQYASDCSRTSAQTAALYAGGTSTNFDIGESFTYQCTKTNVTSSTFPNNRNTATVTGVGVTSSQNVTDSDITEIFLKQQTANPNIKIEKNDTDNLDDTQEIDEDGTADFSVKVTNNGQESLENITITDELSSDCERDISETRDLVRNIGNRDSLFDPGETFNYMCSESSVNSDTFPDEKNTVCTSARGVDSKNGVNDCDDTEITLIIPDSTPSMCEAIESSEGEFGGAPFRTQITCQTTDSSSSCVIEVSEDGSIVNSYSSCTKNITFSNPGDYSIACIVDDEASSDCEMNITVEAMTDVPTGTKVALLALLSLLFTAIGVYFYKKRIV